MHKPTFRFARLAGLALLAAAVVSFPAAAEEAHGESATPTHFPILQPTLESWSFAGIFGKYDTAQLQRGFQIYKEVCSACHSLKMIAFRHLGEEGGPHFTEEQVKALAATYTVQDGPNDAGDMFERPGRPSDHIPSPFPNVQAAAAANGGAAPPDLSLIAKARGIHRGPFFTVLDFFTQYQEAGPDYIHALLTGYRDPPAGFEVPPGTYYNPYFQAGMSLAMPPPLSADLVTYSDGTPQTVDQYSRDVSAFLMWTAEPHLDSRKRIGFQAAIFLIIFAGLLFLTKRKIWSAVPH
jgi:ubiquinol-cytochrome c reductase cytochrome c1 subunit